jgi:hypothetical protein
MIVPGTTRKTASSVFAEFFFKDVDDRLAVLLLVVEAQAHKKNINDAIMKKENFFLQDAFILSPE